MEEDYARKLVKMAKSPNFAKDEEGTLRASMEAFRTELEAHAKAKTALAEVRCNLY